MNIAGNEQPDTAAQDSTNKLDVQEIRISAED